MGRIMNEENDWDHVEGNAIEGPVDCVGRDGKMYFANQCGLLVLI